MTSSALRSQAGVRLLFRTLLGMADDFDHDRFELILDSDAGRYILVEMHSEQKTYLDEGAWTGPHFDEEGAAFISHENGSTEWCDECCEHVVSPHPRFPGTVVVNVDGVPLSLVEYQKRHMPTGISLRLIGRPDPVMIRGFALKQSVGGAFILWSLSSLYDGIVGTGTATASTWYGSWWKWWLKYLEHFLSDVMPHLRKASPTKSTQRPPNWHHDHRFIEEPTCSTYALLLLLLRWSSPGSRGSKAKNDSQSTAWRLCFKAFIVKYVAQEGELEWSVYMDPRVDANPGIPMVGVQKIRVPISNGLVDLRPLYECDDVHCVHTVADLGDYSDGSKVPLEDVMRDAEKLNKRGRWFHKQLVHNLNSMIEAAELARVSELQQDDESASESQAPAFHDCEGVLRSEHVGAASGRKKRMVAALQSKLWSTYSTSLCLFKYFMTVRSLFTGLRCYGFACDASNVGQKNRMMGIISRPDNQTAWLPALD
jgi:hypothetical protein